MKKNILCFDCLLFANSAQAANRKFSRSMKCPAIVKKAEDQCCLGDVSGARERLQRFLARRPEHTWLTENASAYLLLGALHQFLGDHDQGLEVLTRLADSTDTDPLVRIKALAGQSLTHRKRREYSIALACLERGATIMGLGNGPGSDLVQHLCAHRCPF